MPRQLVATLPELRRHPTAKFNYMDEGGLRAGFVALFNGVPRAWENVCRHIPITIDYGDNRFFNAEGTRIVCQTHGASYEPDTGLCVEGPCAGARLKPLQVEVEGDLVYAILPGE